MVARGRVCPVFYRYQPEQLAGPAGLTAETLYVAGCLYGNRAALDAVVARAAQDGGIVVFNGHFHWLDTDRADFAAVADTVAAHHAILGNVEAELISDDDHGCGCGCGYPDYIDGPTVERSNAIADILRHTARGVPECVDNLRKLPRFLVADLGSHRVGVLHGDPESLAGWRLALEAMEPADCDVRGPEPWLGVPTTQTDIADWCSRARVEVFASTHTGRPFSQDYDLPEGRRLVINNGLAGMPNFAGSTVGIATRLSIDPTPPPDAFYGTTLGDRARPLRIDAVPVDYDPERWQHQLLTQWPLRTAGHTAYDTLRRGHVTTTVAQAARGTLRPPVWRRARTQLGLFPRNPQKRT
jgi:hypothetical protein